MALSSLSISWTGEYVNALGSMVNDEKCDLSFASDNRLNWKDGKTAVGSEICSGMFDYLYTMFSPDLD